MGLSDEYLRMDRATPDAGVRGYQGVEDRPRKRTGAAAGRLSDVHWAALPAAIWRVVCRIEVHGFA